MDPDVDISVPAQRVETRPSPLPVLALVSAGGVVGALARYLIGLAWTHPAGAFPWATWTINVTGCFLIGVLLTLIARFRPQQRYLRPFLATGVLGGYTTFSTAVVDLQQARPAVALAYLAATLLGALAAVWAGSTLAGVGAK